MSRRYTFLNENYLAAQDIELTAERTAQVESVLRIISESIEKLKISFVLPKIFENPITMRQYLSDTEFEECVTLLEDYLRDKKAHKFQEPYSNFRLIKIIDMFQENYKIIDVLPDWFDDLSEDDKDLLEAFRLLYTITESRLKKSAISELIKEKIIHQIYHENERVKKNILDFQTKLHNQKISLRWKLAAKDGIIQKYEEDLAKTKRDNNEKIKQEIAKSSRRIRNIHQASVSRQKELEEELEKTKANYEKLLKENLKQEKDARDEKNKLLIQLQSLVRKYDQNIGDKIRENMYLQEHYDELKRQFDEFFIEYQREEIEYEEIMTRKEEEERRKHEERLMLFMMNRAARTIQRHWRRFRREKKKKGKKGKGVKGGGKGAGKKK